MLERDLDCCDESSGAMLFRFLKSLLMILPQSTCYRVLRDRLTSIARFRQSNGSLSKYHPLFEKKISRSTTSETKIYAERIFETRKLHCDATWTSIRQDSLETKYEQQRMSTDGSTRLEWLGYSSKEDEEQSVRRFREDRFGSAYRDRIEEINYDYSDLESIQNQSTKINEYTIEKKEIDKFGEEAESAQQTSQPWLQYWVNVEK
jgi:hypothetical protein